MRSLLLSYAQTCAEEHEPAYFYDNKRDMNIYCHKGNIMPFVETEENIVSLATKTESMRESDDAFNELFD